MFPSRYVSYQTLSIELFYSFIISHFIKLNGEQNWLWLVLPFRQVQHLFYDQPTVVDTRCCNRVSMQLMSAVEFCYLSNKHCRGLKICCKCRLDDRSHSYWIIQTIPKSNRRLTRTLCNELHFRNIPERVEFKHWAYIAKCHNAQHDSRITDAATKIVSAIELRYRR